MNTLSLLKSAGQGVKTTDKDSCSETWLVRVLLDLFLGICLQTGKDTGGLFIHLWLDPHC